MLRKVSILLGLTAVLIGFFGCAPLPVDQAPAETATPIGSLSTPTPSGPTATPLPQRPVYQPGELVAYIAQTGDTLPALAARFNTSIAEIREANPIIPPDASTMPPGLPMEIPIYYRAFWGTPFQIIPDSQFVNGPAGISFESAEFAGEYRGWINTYQEYAAGANRSGPELIELVASNYSVSPRLLLAVSEYLAGALTNPALPEASSIYPLRHRNPLNQGYYQQLIWTANTLNQGYYQWRMGTLLELDLPDGTLVRPDPWQNAASVALQRLFSLILTADEYHRAVSPDGFAATWLALYGDPWTENEPHIPGSLRQPGLLLPFSAGQVWAYTGGPHTAWGSGEPAAAIDFAPATSTSGCYISNEWTTAMADGLVTRAEPGFLMLDLDKDGDERTGWVLFYLHIDGRDQIAAGTEVEAGDILGHPSCVGGNATGTHVHIARKYNGEWIVADSPVPFVLEGWQVIAGARPYLGQLKRFDRTITASESAILGSSLQATGNFDGVILTPLPTPTRAP